MTCLVSDILFEFYVWQILLYRFLNDILKLAIIIFSVICLEIETIGEGANMIEVLYMHE
jgi:hypothetical protein